MTCTPKHRKAKGVPSKRVPVPRAFTQCRYSTAPPLPTRADIVAELGDGPVTWHVISARNCYAALTLTARRRDGDSTAAHTSWRYYGAGAIDDDD